MAIRSRIERLESSSAFAGPAVREVTEEEFYELSVEEKTNYLRGGLRLTVREDPEEEQYTLPPPADINHITAEELGAFKQHMDAYMARVAARRAARQAAKASAAVPSPRPGIEEFRPMFTHDIDPADGCGRLVRPRLAEFSDHDLDGCVRLGVNGPVAEFYDPNQPRVPKDNPAGGQWMDAGGNPPGRGGQPVHVRDGRVAKGHPSLTGKSIESLSHRGQLKSSRESARAEWGKQAVYHGHKPEAIHQLAADLMAHDAASVEDRTKALQSARKVIDSYGGDWRTAAIHASKGGDATKTKGIDVAAESMARQYPHLFQGGEGEHSTDRLFEMLAAGNPLAMSEDEAYGQALNHLDEVRKQARAERQRGGGKGPKAKTAYQDDVPFAADSEEAGR